MSEFLYLFPDYEDNNEDEDQLAFFSSNMIYRQANL